MERKELDKYFIYETPPNPFHPPESFPGTELFVIKNDVIEGACMFGCVWFTGVAPESDVYKPHYHDFDELLVFIGSDPDNPRELNGEVEFWFENEKYLITKTCAIFIPKKVVHNPMIIRRVDRPILWVNSSPSVEMSLHYPDDPKWSNLKEAPEIDDPAWPSSGLPKAKPG